MKKGFIALLLFCSLALISCKGKGESEMKESIVFKNDNEMSFSNDLKITDIGDPFMLKISSDSYYMYCTSAGDGFFCWHSTDMINWGDKTKCYTRPENGAWSTDSYWAPEVVAYEGRYYMFYTARHSSGSLKIGLAISETPNGPFVDYKNEPLFDPGYATIDANILIDDDGSKYLYYSRDCSENVINNVHTSQIYGVKLKDDLTGIAGEPILLSTPEQKWEKASGSYVWNEGPEMIKHNGKYYLTYSANYYESALYSVGYSVSDSPLGPFIKASNNPILTAKGLTTVSGTGHHSFVESPDGTEIWAAYHSHTFVEAPSGNRKVNITRVSFGADGLLYMNGPLTAPEPVPSGTKGFTNVSRYFTASIDGEVASKLTDGLIQVRKTENAKAVLLSYDESESRIVTLSTDAGNAVKLRGIAVYATDLAALKLCCNGTDCSALYTIPEDQTSPIILSFDEISAETLTLELVFNARHDSIRLSEIELFQ